jgi:starch synthase (maltosyl-transferring)
VIGRIPIVDVQPAVHCGRRPAKAVPGEFFQVSATVFREGHEMLGAAVVLRDPDGQRRPLALMHELAPGSDRYGADVSADRVGLWHFQVEAWGDPIAHWRHDAGIKVPIGQDAELMLEEGARLFERAARQPRAHQRAVRQAGRPPPGGKSPALDGRAEVRSARAVLEALAVALRDHSIRPAGRLAAVGGEEVAAALRACPLRELLTRSAAFPLIVHRERALYGSWYEFFPRSEGARVDPVSGVIRSGTLRTAARRLDAIAEMGFDIAYLPPVHPIGSTARKGPNNTVGAGADGPGSPWAIGSATGGHDAIHPDLGTLADFDAFVSRARQLGLEVAMDFALQASPDHPWVREHPEWFSTRADGSIAYAENPPKRYQDIFPLNFDNDPEGIYAEMLRVLRFWMDRGIRVFRVDNPHTKPLRFWDRLLAEVAGTDPDVLFLAEAFTRPAMMHTLAAIGFHQSYTYFTWRNHADALTDYLRELSGPAAAYMRPNFFVNTPDILSDYLQHAGPAAFGVRAVLAAMLSPSWGVYSGYELCENQPAAPGSEEYLDSEKYQYRPRDWGYAQRTGFGITSFITRLNAIRRSHPALHQLRNLRFHHCDQPDVLCFSKNIAAGPAGALPSDTILIVVNLDPHQAREATVWLDGPALGIDVSAGFGVTDELTGESYRWGQANYVRLDPATAPAHIFTVTS